MTVVGVFLFQSPPVSTESASTETTESDYTNRVDQQPQCTDARCDAFCKQYGFMSGSSFQYNQSDCPAPHDPVYPGLNDSLACVGASCCCKSSRKAVIDRITQDCRDTCEAITTAASQSQQLAHIWDYCTTEFSLPKRNTSNPRELIISGVAGTESYCRQEAHCFNDIQYSDTSCRYQGAVLGAKECLQYMCQYQLQTGASVNVAEQRIQEAMSIDTCNLAKGATSSYHYKGVHYNHTITITPNYKDEFASPDCSQVTVR